MLMSNVDGVYSSDPRANADAERIRTFPLGGFGSEDNGDAPDLSGKSLSGRGGMASKVRKRTHCKSTPPKLVVFALPLCSCLFVRSRGVVWRGLAWRADVTDVAALLVLCVGGQVDAAAFAQTNGVHCVVASGMVDPSLGLHRTILDVVEGLDIGTLFPAIHSANNSNTSNNSTSTATQPAQESEADAPDGENAAFLAREGGNALRGLPAESRSGMSFHALGLAWLDLS